MSEESLHNPPMEEIWEHVGTVLWDMGALQIVPIVPPGVISPTRREWTLGGRRLTVMWRRDSQRVLLEYQRTPGHVYVTGKYKHISQAGNKERYLNRLTAWLHRNIETSADATTAVESRKSAKLMVSRLSDALSQTLFYTKKLREQCPGYCDSESGNAPLVRAIMKAEEALKEVSEWQGNV
jgi:hypothetical protein